MLGNLQGLKKNPKMPNRKNCRNFKFGLPKKNPIEYLDGDFGSRTLPKFINFNSCKNCDN